MISNKNQMKFAEIKKFLLKKGFRISKIQKTDKNNNLKTISLTFFF